MAHAFVNCRCISTFLTKMDNRNTSSGDIDIIIEIISGIKVDNVNSSQVVNIQEIVNGIELSWV